MSFIILMSFLNHPIENFFQGKKKEKKKLNSNKIMVKSNVLKKSYINQLCDWYVYMIWIIFIFKLFLNRIRLKFHFFYHMQYLGKAHPDLCLQCRIFILKLFTLQIFSFECEWGVDYEMSSFFMFWIILTSFELIFGVFCFVFHPIQVYGTCVRV